jgi:hypothetical protein
MRTMHYRVLALAAWLLFLNNLERVSKFIGDQRIDLLTPYAYVFVALATVITLAFPVIHRVSPSLILSMGAAVFLIFKAFFGYPLWGGALPLTVTELCAFLVTALLVRQVILAVREFETSIVNFTIARIGHPTKDLAIEQSEMYQEVRRAREFGRPLTMMAVKPQHESHAVAVEKMVEEVQQATMKQYVLAALAKTLKKQFSPYSIIAQNSDHFLVLLPEIAEEDCPQLTVRLREAAREVNGLNLQIGMASLPATETFDELIEVAHNRMSASAAPREVTAPRVTSTTGQVAPR